MRVRKLGRRYLFREFPSHRSKGDSASSRRTAKKIMIIIIILYTSKYIEVLKKITVEGKNLLLIVPIQRISIAYYIIAIDKRNILKVERKFCACPRI
jgi:hypothetical protein